MLVTPEHLEPAYDYVIAGGGTAGLCLAARLTEDPSVSVLVIEAGDANANDPAILRPASYGSHFGQRAYDWGHKTVPQEHCNGTEYPWPRGKGLGGSSAINFLCWVKPPASEINDIERLGNPGWNWDNYAQFSHKSEKFTFPEGDDQTKHYSRIGDWKAGGSGPLLTAFPGKVIAAELDIQQTLINVGIPVAAQPINGDPKGVFFAPSTIDPTTQTRSYAASAYYFPNNQRSNLHVLVSALVSKVIMEDDATGSHKANGVEFLYGDSVHNVRVKREAILSAGGLKSCQILELSGIGRRSILENLKIPVKVDLPSVGENVQEHMYIGITWELREGVSFDTLDLLRDTKVAAEHIELHKAGQGAFTTGITGFAFVPLDMLSSRAEEIHQAAKKKIRGDAPNYPPGLVEQYEIQLERLDDGAPGVELISFPGFLSLPNPPQPNKKYVSMLVAMNHCFSRGAIHSVSSDPTVDPAIDPRYFEQRVDLDTFVEAVKFVRKLSEVEPLKSMIVNEVNPGLSVQSDSEVGDWVKKYMATTYHTAGATSMLPRDKGGVVDHTLKVYGTQNVRVVDLSVVPLHFAAHPVATVYAIAEQAADIIKRAL